jgi:hypothetical protein
VDRHQIEAIEEAIQERKRAKSTSPTQQGSYPTAAALVMARTMKRLARKYGDPDLARRAKELNELAQEALMNRQSNLSNSRNGLPPDQRKSANRAPLSQGDLFALPERLESPPKADRSPACSRPGAALPSGRMPQPARQIERREAEASRIVSVGLPEIQQRLARRVPTMAIVRMPTSQPVSPRATRRHLTSQSRDKICVVQPPSLRGVEFALGP